MTQQLEAMKLTDPHDHPEPHTMKWTQAEMDYINNRVETAVRQAIEQAQKQEPDAVQAMIDWYNSGNEDWEEFSRLLSMLTSPPQRQPLTDEQIKKLLKSMHGEPYPNDLYTFARAIEAAHGIKGEA